MAAAASPLTDSDEWESVESENTNERGCSHYIRGCRIVAPCCNEIFPCRQCHDAIKNDLAFMKNVNELHEVERSAIVEVVCNRCNKKQGIVGVCEDCGYNFGNYFCKICPLWDDDAEKKGTFHCSGCGICRVGGAENFFHCVTCCGCYPLNLQNNHKCVAKAMKNNCPVCLRDLFQSTAKVLTRGCGHPIHEACYSSMRHKGGLMAIRCPLCNKSDKDISWQQMDDIIKLNPMGEQSYVTIYCNDCCVKSVALFHFVGLKCRRCGSYNVRNEGKATEEEIEIDRQERKAARQKTGNKPVAASDSDYETETVHEERA